MKLWESLPNMEAVQQYYVSILQVVCVSPCKPIISHFSYHYEQSTILFHFGCFHKQFDSFSLPNYFHYSGN